MNNDNILQSLKFKYIPIYLIDSNSARMSFTFSLYFVRKMLYSNAKIENTILQSSIKLVNLLNIKFNLRNYYNFITAYYEECKL